MNENGTESGAATLGPPPASMRSRRRRGFPRRTRTAWTRVVRGVLDCHPYCDGYLPDDAMDILDLSRDVLNEEIAFGLLTVVDGMITRESMEAYVDGPIWHLEPADWATRTSK